MRHTSPADAASSQVAEESLPSWDLTDLYPKFYWGSISPHIQSAIRYLNVTSSGRQWIANLYSNVFCAERELSLCGPEH